jgi:mono/diheme cytochrome c family protein
MKKITLCLSGLLFFVFSVTFVHSADDAKALFEKKCSACHSSDRPKSKKKTAEEWQTTVMRMKNVNGGAITDEEAQIILDYLTRNYRKVTPS